MNIKEAMQHPLVAHAKENLWGSAITTVPVEFQAGFDGLSPHDQQLVRAFFTGATTACGVAESLASDPNYGPAYQERRYTSVNAWYRFLKKNLPKNLSQSFGYPVELKSKTGGVLKYDPDWLPEKNRFSISGPATYEGFVLPRQIIDVIDNPNLVFGSIDVASRQATILQAIAKTAEYQFQNGVDSSKIKNRLFDQSITLELHPDYWLPLLSRLNRYLPQELRKDLF